MSEPYGNTAGHSSSDSAATYAPGRSTTLDHDNEAQAAISWSAVFAGAVAAGSLSLILVLLGLGFGFAAVSPWATEGAGAEAIGIGTILWLTFMQLASAGLGGFLAGRLRQQWPSAHPDEVYFRDTAHGFLAWGIATLATAAFLGSALAAIAGGLTSDRGDGAMAGYAAPAAGDDEGMQERAVSYFVDMLFRPAAPADDIAGPQARSEAARIFLLSLHREALANEDREYLAQRVSTFTGLEQQQAAERVDDVYARLSAAEQELRDALDDAREAATYATLWMFIALLIGAFFASYAATIGGRQRDPAAYS